MRYIYCHPLFDERKCAHRFSFQLKQAFTSDGSILERFDYRGTGEAEGEFADVSLESLREDIAQYTGGREACLIGVRFGASLAFDYCIHRLGPVRNLVLLEPIIDGAEYVDYLYHKQHIKDLMTGGFAAKLRDKGYENLEGYKTSIDFIEQVRKFSLVAMAKDCSVKNFVSIVQISNRPEINSRTNALANLLEDSAEQVLVETVKLPVFWERIPDTDYAELTRKVLEWCLG